MKEFKVGDKVLMCNTRYNIRDVTAEVIAVGILNGEPIVLVSRTDYAVGEEPKYRVLSAYKQDGTYFYDGYDGATIKHDESVTMYYNVTRLAGTNLQSCGLEIEAFNTIEMAAIAAEADAQQGYKIIQEAVPFTFNPKE